MCALDTIRGCKTPSCQATTFLQLHYQSGPLTQMRSISKTYQDPLEIIWLHAASALGMRVERDSDVFASWDGNGVLRIGIAETLDPDDSLAQMILHEICHSLIEGPDSWDLPDWGLQIDNPKHRVREHACLRLQAALTHPFGLRQFLAATTNFRRYYDDLPTDPLEDNGDPAVISARIGFERSQEGPQSTIIATALRKTAQIAEAVQDVASLDSLWMSISRPE